MFVSLARLCVVYIRSTGSASFLGGGGGGGLGRSVN